MADPIPNGEPEARRPRLTDLADRLEDKPLISELTDQLDRTRRLLAGSPEEAAESALNRLSSEKEVEARIAAELAMVAPLAEPERFSEAHRLVIRALEVLDREGSRDPRVPRLGPLTAPAQMAVEFVAEYIVQSYAESVVGRLKSLYARREAQCPPEAPERRILARARVEMERLGPGFSGGGPLGTVLLVGGLLFPVLASLTNYLGAIDFADRRIIFSGLGALFVLFFIVSSVLLRGAATARHRSRLIMQQPLAALWETIGHAGNPPEDDSVQFASVAIVLTAVVWFVLPAATAVVYFLL